MFFRNHAISSIVKFDFLFSKKKYTRRRCHVLPSPTNLHTLSQKWKIIILNSIKSIQEINNKAHVLLKKIKICDFSK